MESLDVTAQVACVRRGALVVRAPELVTFVVTGGERLSWLNGLVTCDLAPRKPGDAVYGLAVAQKGRILTDVVVAVDAERVLVAVQRKTADVVAASFERYLMMEDAEVLPAFDRFAIDLVHGPRAAEVLAAARAAGGVGGLLDRTGLGGAVIFSEGDSAPRVREAIALALPGLGGAFGDDRGWDALRIARGVPRFGVDFDESSYPQEASLEKTAVSFNKGCYLGQEVVCMLEMRGHVKKKLVSLVIDGEGAPPPHAKVQDAVGADAGEVTSAAVSPSLHASVALAMVKYASAGVGTELKVGERNARVVEPPA